MSNAEAIERFLENLPDWPPPGWMICDGGFYASPPRRWGHHAELPPEDAWREFLNEYLDTGKRLWWNRGWVGGWSVYQLQIEYGCLEVGGNGEIWFSASASQTELLKLHDDLYTTFDAHAKWQRR